MRLIRAGSDTGWGRELRCTGKGNNLNGCGALLLVEKGDLHIAEAVACFKCPGCNAWTDVATAETGGLRISELPKKPGRE